MVNDKLRPRKRKKSGQFESDASLIDRSIERTNERTIGEGKKRDDVDRIGKSNEPIALFFVAVLAFLSLSLPHSLSLSLSLSISLHVYSFTPGGGDRRVLISRTVRVPPVVSVPRPKSSPRSSSSSSRVEIARSPPLPLLRDSSYKEQEEEEEEEKETKKGRIIRKKERMHVKQT